MNGASTPTQLLMDSAQRPLFSQVTQAGVEIFVQLLEHNCPNCAEDVPPLIPAPPLMSAKDEGREMKPDEAFSTNGWDIALKRFDIYVNSGASGPGGNVEVQVIKDGDYATFTQAPATGFVQDTPDRVFNTVDDGWYFYDLGVHRLVTRTELFYLLHTSAGAYVKLRMLSYYDDNGTPASISLEYAPISAP